MFWEVVRENGDKNRGKGENMDISSNKIRG